MERIVILTGAGVSAESGLGTFRDAGGLWARFDLAAVATPQGFARDPERVHAFYNLRRRLAREAEPNAAHRALARLVAARPASVTLVTQNIDDLHERAGTPGVIHMHGEVLNALCAACGHRWCFAGDMGTADRCPACTAARVRPDVVWFGEVPQAMDLIAERLAACTQFVAIGTSGAVWPAAGFVAEAAAAGAETLEITLEPGEGSARFDRHRHGPATETVPGWVGAVLGA